MQFLTVIDQFVTA